MWRCVTSLGTFYIKKLQNGRFGLIFDNTVWGEYSIPAAAADDVYTHVTGCADWDMRYDIEAPTDIYQWERL